MLRTASLPAPVGCASLRTAHPCTPRFKAERHGSATRPLSIHLPMRVVLLLGAGFSRAFGLPVMSEFFPHVRRSLRISEEQKAMIARLQLKARQGGGAIGHQEDNLEHVLSFTLFGLMSANAPAGAAAPEATQLIDCLRRVYSAESAIAEVEGNRANLTRFFGFTKTNLSPNVKSLTVVTTNYDALTEYAMFTLGERAYLPGTENASPDNGQGLYAPALSRISLCKLHGSVSWLKGADDKVDVNGQLWYRTLQGAGPNGSDLQVRLADLACLQRRIHTRSIRSDRTANIF